MNYTILDIEKKYKVIGFKLVVGNSILLVNPSSSDIDKVINKGYENVEVVYTFEKQDLIEHDEIKYTLCGNYNQEVKGHILNSVKHLIEFKSIEIKLIKNHGLDTYNIMLFIGENKPVLFLNNIGIERPHYVQEKQQEVYDINEM